MKRRLFNLVAAVSLVLCVASGVLCVRSHWRNHGWLWHRYNNAGSFLCVSSGDGYLLLASVPDMSSAGSMHTYLPGSLADATHLSNSGAVEDRIDLILFSYERGTRLTGQPERYRYWYVALAYWPLMLLFSVLPMFWLRSAMRLRARRHRRARGLCLVCGYNLTGNVSGVCPECGTAIPAKVVEKGATA